MSDTKNEQFPNAEKASLSTPESESSDTACTPGMSGNITKSGYKFKRCLDYMYAGVGFLGKHPFATGLFALIGLIGLGLSIVSYQLDRTDAKTSTEQAARLESKIDGLQDKINTGYKVPKIVGLSYDVARELLLREGWAPNKRHWTYGDTVDVKSGNGPIFWERGYWELDSCSGSGLANCLFEFFDPEKRLLVVITEGEEAKDGAYHAKVSRVFFDESNK